MAEHSLRSIFATSTQSHIKETPSAAASPPVLSTAPSVSDYWAHISIDEHKAAIEELRRRRKLKNANKKSRCVVICSYVLLFVVIIILVAATWQRVFPNGRFDHERICVALDRFQVRPRTPAIDSEPGSFMEPFAHGYFAFDRHQKEIWWDFEDSLGVEPHEIFIRGPLSNTHNDVAPVFFSFGLQRNARLHLGGVANIGADKIDIIEEHVANATRRRNHPHHHRGESESDAREKYYISMTEQLIDGTVRELVRGRIYTNCAKGVE